MSQKTRSTFVLVEPNEILQAMVGLRDVAVVTYERHGPSVELMVEQVPGVVACPTCGARAQVKERPVVRVEHPGWELVDSNWIPNISYPAFAAA